jgi:hypothetical protein
MRAPAWALFLLACAGCNHPPGAMALYDTSPTRSDFFALPWPSDSRLTSDGKSMDLTGFYNPGGAIGSYLTAIGSEPLSGFGTSSAIYFRFDAPLDATQLPATGAASISPSSPVFVVDVTPSSPTYGKRQPLSVHFQSTAGLYIGSNWLALLPEPGFPLRPATTYAAVITDSTVAADGGSVHRDPRFDSVLPFSSDITSALGVDGIHIAAATVFTTQNPTPIMKALRDAVYAQAPAPTVMALDFADTKKNTYNHYRGMYASPNFQEGDPPYKTTGGRIHVDANGVPQVVRTEMLRFAVTIPLAPMPAAGWPIVLYAHGTGGDYESFLGDRSADTAANVLDENGNVITHMAMISIDQVLHGPRDPTMSDPDLTFFNFQNIVAAHDNPKQGGLDDFQLLRLVEGFNVASAPMTNEPIKFDPDRIYFKGHSQGGLTGPLFLAYEPKVKAAILSGAGATLILGLLYKTEPTNVAALVQAVIAEDVDQYHPLLTLLQAYMESSDPGNYGRLFFREPPEGLAPKSIYQSIGIVDNFAPVPTLKSFGLSMGLQPVNPMVEPIDDFPTLLNLPWMDPPIMSNFAGGKATGVVCEYQVPVDSTGKQKYDGHFVVFDDPHAIVQSNAFLGLHATTGIAQLIK